MNNEVLLEVKDISKSFGATRALNGVNFKLRKGEIHGLIGENGSGKSTLSSIISGIIPADAGELFYKKTRYKPKNMIETLQDGIGMIVQEGGTIPDITVAENIFLGEVSKFRVNGLINKKKIYDETMNALNSLNIKNISPNTITSSLSLHDRKLLEVVRVTNKNPDILIIDETTTALSQEGREIIYEYIKKMIEEEKAVIFITHDLDELMDVCNVLTVLRDGELIKTITKSEFDSETIKQLMIGRELKGNYYRNDYDGEIMDEVILSVQNVFKNKLLHDISFDLRKGEILGIGGLSHSGMHTLGKCIFGNEKIDSGSIVHKKYMQKITKEREAMRVGMGYVSKDRDTEALSLKTSIRNNISVIGLDNIQNKMGLITRSREKKYVESIMQELNVKARTMDQSVRELSGGNKQKVTFGRWLGRGSSVLILDCPTRGVDIGVKQAMYQLIYKMKQEGKSIILISEELQELIGMSDRILIMKDGTITGQFERSETLSESDIIGKMI